MDDDVYWLQVSIPRSEFFRFGQVVVQAIMSVLCPFQFLDRNSFGSDDEVHYYLHVEGLFQFLDRNSFGSDKERVMGTIIALAFQFLDRNSFGSDAAAQRKSK